MNLSKNKLPLRAFGPILVVALALNACGENLINRSSSFTEATGVLDEDFVKNLGTGPSSSIEDLLVLSDGGILVAGQFLNFGTYSNSYLFKLNPDGTPDTLFNSNLGSGPNDVVYTLLQSSDGSIYVGGAFDRFNNQAFGRLAKLSAEGIPDPGFRSAGDGFENGNVKALAEIEESIVVGGSFRSYRNQSLGRIAKIDSSGNLNTTFLFNNGTGFNLEVNTLLNTTDGVLAGGAFESFGGVNTRHLAKLNSNGSLNTSFSNQLGTVAFNSQVWNLLMFSDNILLAAGAFSSFNASSYGHIVALAPTGSLINQSSAQFGMGFSNDVYSMDMQANGKLILGGNFSTYSGESAPGLIRLNSDWDMDSSFNDALGTGFEGTVKIVRVQSDGKILVAGNFGDFNRNGTPFLVRLK